MNGILPHDNLIPVYRFTVCVGMHKLNFSKITGIKNSVNFETVQEGGLNNRVHYFYAPQKEQGRIVLERGLYKKKSGEAMLIPGSIFRGDMVIFLTDSQQSVLRSFAVESPVLESWEISDFDSMAGEIIIHTATVIHGGITEIDGPNNLYMKKFDFM